MRTVVAMGVLCLAGCGAPSVDTGVVLTVADSPEALTTKGGDTLFVLTLAQAPRSYALTDVLIDGKLAGMTGTALNFTLIDANANGALEAGEALTVREPPVNLFDATTVGQSVTVRLSVKSTGSVYTSLASAVWVPTN